MFKLLDIRKCGDVIFRYIGDEHHYMIIGERNNHIDVRNISFKGTNLITNLLISQIRDRTLRSGMAGGGLIQGILCRFNFAYIENCDFNNLWHAIGSDNCKMDIHNINGTQLYGGAHCTANSRIYIKRSFLRGIGGTLTIPSISGRLLGRFIVFYICLLNGITKFSYWIYIAIGK